MKHVIMDNTENTGRPYIDWNGNNVGNSDTADQFDSEESATKRMNELDPENTWAYISEIENCR